MSEEDRSGGKMEELKAKGNERLERFNEKGAQLHDRISEVLGSPKGGEAYGGEEGEENEAEQDEENDAEQGEENKAEQGEE